MRIVNLFARCFRAPACEARWLRKFIGASAFALLQGCVMNAPSCDGRLEPINLPAPLGMDAATAVDRDIDTDKGAVVRQEMEDRSSQRNNHE